MAKILCNYFGLSMAAEGKSEFVGRQAAAFLGYVQQDAERCAENCGCAEDLSDAPEKIKREILRNDEELRRREQTAPGVEHDVVAIYDNAGIPSIMHRFRRVTNKELFGGSDAVHPAFIIGGEVYDEIYISVYENTMINGKPYSLPLQEPVTNITMEDVRRGVPAEIDYDGLRQNRLYVLYVRDYERQGAEQVPAHEADTPGAVQILHIRRAL